MFQGLSIGSSVYVLTKDDMNLRIGEVSFVGNPKQVFNQLPGNFLTPKYSVDIKVSVDGQQYEFNQLPGELDAFCYNSGTLICDTQESLLKELAAIESASKKHIEDVPTHERRLEECRRIRSDIDPQVKKEAEQTRRIDSLQSQVSDIRAMLSELLEQTKK